MVALSVAPQLAGYRDLTPLGRGGYSEVYRAYQERFDRWVAVKVLTFSFADDRAERLFLRECQIAGRASTHPHVVTVYEAGLEMTGRPYIAMELCDGGSVADRLRAGGAFEVTEALRIAIALAGALESAHRAGVVHRDVKPGNVLLSRYGQPALGDFGLSVVAEHQGLTTGLDALSPYHAPPEVLEGVRPTHVSDVYSLASTTYTMLAGRPPHQLGPGEALTSLLARIVRAEVPPVGRPDVPRSLEAALRGALARDPAVRTPTALAFAQALQRTEAELRLGPTHPVVLDPPDAAPSPRPDPPPPCRPRPRTWGGHPGTGGGFGGPEVSGDETVEAAAGGASGARTREDETVARSRVPGPWPPAPPRGGTAGRSRRRLALVAGGLLALTAVGGAAGLAMTGDGGGEAAGRADATPTSETTAPPGSTATTAPASTTTVPATSETTVPEPTALTVADVAASATAPDSTDGCGNSTGYGAANVADGANDTGWSVVGEGTGESLTLALDGEHRVLSVGLLPGYAKVDACSGTDRFPENRRPTAVTWRFDDGTEVTQDLEDTPELQTVAVDATTTTVELTIDGVTSDPRRDFTVVSEVAVQGT
jgi:serine/threonine-protein kinase PknK